MSHREKVIPAYSNAPEASIIIPYPMDVAMDIFTKQIGNALVLMDII